MVRTARHWAPMVGAITGLLALSNLAAEAQPATIGDRRVVRVQSIRADGGRLSQSGFFAEVKGDMGVVTALHGVAGGSNQLVRAEGRVFEAKLRFVSVERDLAFLKLDDPQRRAPSRGFAVRAFSGRANEPLRVVGYPKSSFGQFDLPATSHDKYPLRRLREPIQDAGPIRNALVKRGSPSLDQNVVMLSGPLQEGHSGAAVLDRDGNVVAVGSGGVGPGMAWAMPIDGVEWIALEDEPRIDKLGREPTKPLFDTYVNGAASYGYDIGVLIGAGGSQLCQGGDCGGIETAFTAGAFMSHRLAANYWARGELSYSHSETSGSIVAGTGSVPTGETYEIEFGHVDASVVFGVSGLLSNRSVHAGLGAGVGFVSSHAFWLTRADGSEVELDAPANTILNAIGIVGTRLSVGRVAVVPEFRLVYGSSAGDEGEDPRTARIAGNLIRYMFTVGVSK